MRKFRPVLTKGANIMPLVKVREDKMETELNESVGKAKSILNDPQKIKELLDKALARADKAQGPLKDIWVEIQLMFGLVRDWVKGEYRQVPTRSILAILGGLIYLVTPIDAIPDWLILIGFGDDAVVLGLVVKQVRQDLQKYGEWKNTEQAEVVVDSLVQPSDRGEHGHP